MAMLKWTHLGNGWIDTANCSCGLHKASRARKKSGRTKPLALLANFLKLFSAPFGSGIGRTDFLNAACFGSSIPE